MSNLREILTKIDETRKCLNDLLNEKNNPLDIDVIALSQLLDEILNQYHKLLKNKDK